MTPHSHPSPKPPTSDGTVAALLRHAREGVAASDPEADARTAEDEDPEDGRAYRAYGEFRDGPGFGVDFRLADGREHELSYAHLFSNDLDPSGTLTLVFTGGDTVTVRGKNLRPLRAALRRRLKLRLGEMSDEKTLTLPLTFRSRRPPPRA